MYGKAGSVLKLLRRLANTSSFLIARGPYPTGALPRRMCACNLHTFIFVQNYRVCGGRVLP